jgi:hypothetical protein
MFASASTRRLITALAALACAAAFLLGEAIPSRGASPARHHHVHAGETLWGIAEHAYPGDDPREAVYRIREANHIPGSSIVVGEELVLP